MNRIFLKKDRERLWMSGHPWIYSGAIDKVEGKTESGEVVEVYNNKKEFIGYGHYNSGSKLAIRMLESQKGTAIDKDWYRDKIRKAIDLRESLAIDSNGYRLIFSESDYLPGLIVEKFGDYLILQAATSGMEKDKGIIVQALVEEIPGLKGIYEKSEGDGRRQEGLKESVGVLYGEVPDTIEVYEGKAKFTIDLKGQKTGFYADQRDNRKKIGELAKGKTLLDVCSYTGGFSLHAMVNGAKGAALVDISEDALSVAKENLREFENVEYIKGNVFDILRELAKEGRKWDVVNLDPPKLAPSKRDLDKALRAYKDIILNGLRLTKKGGFLAIYSCSGAVTAVDLRMALAYAIKDAGVKGVIVEQLHQSPCHPVSVSVPETEYLKGFVVRVL